MSSARGKKVCCDVEQPATEASKVGKNSDGNPKKKSSSVSGKKRKPSSSASYKDEASPIFPFPAVKKSSYSLPSGEIRIIAGHDPDAAWEETKKKAAEDWNWDKLLDEVEEEDPWCVGAVKRKDWPDWEAYKKELHDNQGYELTIQPALCYGANFEPWSFKVDNELTTFKEFRAMCRGAITHFNRRNEPRYRFISEDADAIEHVTRKFQSDCDYYFITFKACAVRNPSMIRSFRAKYLFGTCPGSKGKKIKQLISCKPKDDSIWEEEKKNCSGFPCCQFRFKPPKLF